MSEISKLRNENRVHSTHDDAPLCPHELLEEPSFATRQEKPPLKAKGFFILPVVIDGVMAVFAELSFENRTRLQFFQRHIQTLLEIRRF